jgi:hypothetical protein
MEGLCPWMGFLKDCMDNKEIIYDLVKEVREEQKLMKEDVSEIKQVLTLNTFSLQEHMRRTDVLEKLYYSQSNRLDTLEEPQKIRRVIAKKYVKVAGILATTLSLLAAIAKWSGLL